MKWIEVTVITKKEAEEAVSNILFDTDVQGIVVKDLDCDDEGIEFKDGIALKVYYENNDNFLKCYDYIKEKINSLSKFGIDCGNLIIRYDDFGDEDWQANWKKNYKTTRIDDRIVIKPLWEDYNPKGNEIVIKIDPEMAFGSGTHMTTAMCIKALERYVNANSTVFDIGTGSGILAICASKLGAQKVIGVDLDIEAVKCAEKNASYNDINNIYIYNGNLMDTINEKADIIVANLLADIIINMIGDLNNFLNADGYFICSGILNTRKKEVVEELTKYNFKICEIKEDSEWCCIICEKGELQGA